MLYSEPIIFRFLTIADTVASVLVVRVHGLSIGEVEPLWCIELEYGVELVNTILDLFPR